MVRAALLVQRNRYHPVELIRTWARISATLAPYAEYSNFLRMTFVYVISISRMNMEQIKKVLESAPEQTDAWALELYEQIAQEWGEKAKIEGKIERSIEVVLNAHANGLAIPLIANITALDEAEVIRILKEHGRV